jgi:SAM-dependent methyltransferase
MMEEAQAHIYQDGRHYDQLFAEDSKDIPFWISQANQYGDPVLELACGTGRITLALASAGFKVTGIDIAEGMLSEARRKSSGTGLGVSWLNADMRNFDLGEAFSLIILPANTLCHLLNLNDFEACMASAKKHLAPNGRFVIDVFVPKIELLVNYPDKRFPFSEYEDPDGRGRITVTESYFYESDTQIKRIKTYHSIPGEDKEFEGELNMRMYFPQELDALIQYNGFALEHKYGNYGGSAFGADSEKQIVVCRLGGS